MFLTLIIFIAILSLLVFAHEAGHFFTARKFGVKVEEFGFGLPPRIVGLFLDLKKKMRVVLGRPTLTEEQQKSQPTIYSLNWIPIGGFVKLKGENGEETQSDDSFASKSASKRAVILASGVVMNFLLCAVILIFGFHFGLPATLEAETKGAKVSNFGIQVIELIPDLPAQAAGVQVGDTIVSVDGQRFDSIEDLQKYLGNKSDQSISLGLKRQDQVITKTITVKQYSGGTGIGVALVETGIVSYPWRLAIWQGIKSTFLWLVAIVLAFAMIIKNLIIGQAAGVEVSGPVGIAVMTGQAASLGFAYIMQFTALLSLNLAIINILPFPALDGGRILFLVIEKIRGRAVKQQLENLIHNIGFALLMLLVVFVTYRDIIKYGGRIFGVLKGLVGV